MQCVHVEYPKCVKRFTGMGWWEDVKMGHVYIFILSDIRHISSTVYMSFLCFLWSMAR